MIGFNFYSNVKNQVPVIFKDVTNIYNYADFHFKKHLINNLLFI